MADILLITPPFVQPNTPYPATAYLKGFLKREGIDARQYDLSVELLSEIFSRSFLRKVFCHYGPDAEGSDIDDNINRIYNLSSQYLKTIDTVMRFLRGEDDTLANLICMPEFIPQAGRFTEMADINEAFGSLGTRDCALYISTLYLQDISDFIRETVTPNFEIVKYGEKLSLSVPVFSILEEELAGEPNLIETKMFSLLAEQLEKYDPDFVSFTIPFPGNLFSSLRCAQYIKKHHSAVKVIAGGGYPTTELRSMSDKGIFRYFDYIILDDGEIALKNIIKGGELIDTYTSSGFHSYREKPDTTKGLRTEGKGDQISHLDRGCPDFSGLRYDRYFNLCEVVNPMHRLWSDGKWNKMMLAHGCYWGKCGFCDTSLDYICSYDTVEASVLVDWMELVARQTGSYGFHFTDEAAPPKLLREISLELLRRNLNFSWWTNIRFEKSFTGDLCKLISAAGCIAVSGGLEVASDRLLKMINKGITIETATMAMRNFYYSGIMVHTYLMYGLPTQTLQESVDALEIVRQMFRAELVGSGFWHRYAMTLHSPSGQNAETYGVRRKNNHVNTFANNEVQFVENRGYNINIVGDALRRSLSYFMAGQELDRPVHKWFECKAPATTVENSVITDHLIKPDSSRLYQENARIVWIGASQPTSVEEGIRLHGNSSEKTIKFTPLERDFLMETIDRCSCLDNFTSLGQINEIYKKYYDKPFLSFYHSKKWDMLREFGLLQL